MAAKVSFLQISLQKCQIFVKISGFINIPTLPLNSEYLGENRIAGKETPNWKDSGQIEMVGSYAFMQISLRKA